MRLLARIFLRISEIVHPSDSACMSHLSASVESRPLFADESFGKHKSIMLKLNARRKDVGTDRKQIAHFKMMPLSRIGYGKILALDG
jgi:hypothetical protein